MKGLYLFGSLIWDIRFIFLISCISPLFILQLNIWLLKLKNVLMFFIFLILHLQQLFQTMRNYKYNIWIENLNYRLIKIILIKIMIIINKIIINLIKKTHLLFLKVLPKWVINLKITLLLLIIIILAIIMIIIKENNEKKEICFLNT